MILMHNHFVMLQGKEDQLNAKLRANYLETDLSSSPADIARQKLKATSMPNSKQPLGPKRCEPGPADSTLSTLQATAKRNAHAFSIVETHGCYAHSSVDWSQHRQGPSPAILYGIFKGR